VTLALEVPKLPTEADAGPTLLTMAGIATDLIFQATQNPPTVSPPPPNDRAPSS
jgi:hypothetical protein